ncbi:hypothetical protein [Jonesia quinghaiensis]|uniref:hypothetical protein n=1 Tax=Jonesia quinghaiensis TaxID=262806 RepID=UPI00048F59E0|nr:hypothetical protein [Jonesia quinghaiensis]
MKKLLSVGVASSLVFGSSVNFVPTPKNFESHLVDLYRDREGAGTSFVGTAADEGDEVAVKGLETETQQGKAAGVVVLTHLWKQRDKLCAGFTVNSVIGSMMDCLSEAIDKFEEPKCDIATELEWGLFFEDKIDVSSGQVTETRFRLGRCPSQALEGDTPLNITLEDLAVLKIKPSPVHTYPKIGADNPRVINLPVVVYTDSAVQMFTPTLLGQTVSVRVAPVSFTFDWGDGTVLGPVASPGSADVETGYQHTYTTLDPVRISVTTQWSASWSLDGTSWVRVPGFLETTGTSAQLPIVEKVPLLVPDN